MRFVFFLFGLLGTQEAFAFQCASFEDRTMIVFSTVDIDTAWDGCPHLNQRPYPVLIVLNSPGGALQYIEPTLQTVHNVIDLQEQQNVYVKPTVLVRGRCMSACIPLLATFAQMARENRVQLMIDPEVRLGFHMSSDMNGRLYIPETYQYLQMTKKAGMKGEWIAQHMDLFMTPEMTTKTPNDPLLLESGLVDLEKIHETQATLNAFLKSAPDPKFVTIPRQTVFP